MYRPSLLYEIWRIGATFVNSGPTRWPVRQSQSCKFLRILAVSNFWPSGLNIAVETEPLVFKSDLTSLPVSASQTRAYRSRHEVTTYRLSGLKAAWTTTAGF